MRLIASDAELYFDEDKELRKVLNDHKQKTLCLL